MNTRSFAPLIVALGGLLLLGGCQPGVPKDAVATYSYNSGNYTEAFVLRATGKYKQTVTQRQSPQLRSGILSYRPPPTDNVPPPPDIETRTGTWRLLDKPDGSPLPLPSSANLLPPDSVIELKDALAFDAFTDDRPLLLHVDRTLPARNFKLRARSPNTNVSTGLKPPADNNKPAVAG